MRIKFLCPHCDRVCRVPAELAGKQGRCPGCQKGLEVPTESTLQSKRKSSLGEVDAGRSSARSSRASGTSKRRSARKSRLPSDIGNRDSGRTDSRQTDPSRAGRISDTGPPEDHLVEVNADGSPLQSPLKEEAKEEEELSEAEKFRNCVHCARSIPYLATACEHCGGDVTLKGVPWQVLVAFTLFLCAPLPGLIFAQFGLRSARRRRSHINLAWVAIGLNAFSMVANVLYLLGKALNE